MRFFTGIQPTGKLHLGNYFGAIKPAIDLQNNSENPLDNFICVADLHSLTTFPTNLRKNKEELLGVLYACGVDFGKSIVLTQSDIPQHSELYFLLMCLTQMGELERMTQYKDKSNTKRENAGLFSYPVLMAADILLYDTDIVPVGQDQFQHIELTRNLAEKFNKKFGDTFKVPEVYSAEPVKIKSLTHPELKMSKSDTDPDGAIFLLDTAEVIRRKIKKATTDSDTNLSFETGSEGVKNLLNIYKLLTNKTEIEIESYFDNKYGFFKKELTEELIKFVETIQDKYSYYSDYTYKVFDGTYEATEIAELKMGQVREALNL